MKRLLSTRRLTGMAVLNVVELVVCFALWRRGAGWLPVAVMVCAAGALGMILARPFVPRRWRS